MRNTNTKGKTMTRALAKCNKRFILKENCSGEVLDIIVETAQDVYTNKQSTNQSSEDDLVR